LTPELDQPPPSGDLAIAAAEERLAQNLNPKAIRQPRGLDEHVVGWGGIHEAARDNYYITDDSAPAKLGSSLGWLLQLDGDNMRNAFLNAPWVKAVIPIRPMKEIAALNWLSHTAVEGGDGLDDSGGYGAHYAASSQEERLEILAVLREYPWDDAALITHYRDLDPSDLSIRDVLRYVSIRIREKHLKGEEKISEDLGNGVMLNYLRPDRVFEHGFDPLSGGVRIDANPTMPYEVFDQWTEILPTDQVVAVPVDYDPKTGLQK
jgi:hypothetical protein